MGRRKSILEDLMGLPWQVGVVAAAVVFVIFQILKMTITEGIVAQAFQEWFKVLGWGLPAAFLFAALISFIRQLGTKRQYESTQSMADIRRLSWPEFESFMGEHFRREGYFVVETPEGPDGGVDLVLRKDGEKTYVQCKRWINKPVPVEKIRELLGSMAAGRARAGIFVTSGTYTQPARDLARQSGIRLIDGRELARLLDLDPESFGSNESQVATDAQQTCPKCNAPMEQKIAGRGRYRGKPFFGCSRYPDCNGIRNI